jgi:hypothetical protein
VSLEDDGDFECQVLQKEKEPLRAAANLAVIGKAFCTIVVVVVGAMNHY